ncbi:MAG: hypothetical protein LBL99_01215 [Holosporaceae bacterium]|jgi:guanylate kinase|nr:hypothetical protein [Holosporaceae bacterium]
MKRLITLGLACSLLAACDVSNVGFRQKQGRESLENQQISQSRKAIFVISGASGVGKDYMIKIVLAEDKSLLKAANHTTRDQRPGEKAGFDYIYEKDADFFKRQDPSDLIDHAGNVGKEYGILKSDILKLLARKDCSGVIINADLNGLDNVRKAFKNDPNVTVVGILIDFRDESVLRARLKGRKTETPEQIEQRIKWGMQLKKEASKRNDLYVFVNDDATETGVAISAFMHSVLREVNKE